MAKFIITSETNRIPGKRAIYYYKPIGAVRIYRQNYENPDEKMVLVELKSKDEAQKLCDKINSAYNDDFVVEEKMTKKILFNFYDRIVMIDYLKFPNEYNGKPLVFLRLEILKFRRELDRKISPPFLFLIDKLAKFLN